MDTLGWGPGTRHDELYFRHRVRFIRRSRCAVEWRGVRFDRRVECGNFCRPRKLATRYVRPGRQQLGGASRPNRNAILFQSRRSAWDLGCRIPSSPPAFELFTRQLYEFPGSGPRAGDAYPLWDRSWGPVPHPLFQRPATGHLGRLADPHVLGLASIFNGSQAS